MRTFIFGYGTRGDIQPCIALAQALREAGHDALVAGPRSAERLAASYRVTYVPLDDSLTRLWDNPRTRQATARTGTRGIPALQAIAQAARRPAIPSLGAILDDLRAAAHGADLIVHNGPLLACASYAVAEKLAVPLVLSQMYPLFTPTRAFPTALYHIPGGDRLPGFVNRASYRGMLSMLRGLTSRQVETWRERSLGLPPRSGGREPLRDPDGHAVPVLNAVSSHIVPPPPDWPDWVRTTGYWLLPAPGDWAPPRNLADFLAAGAPPVYIGFGSMCDFDPGQLRELAVEAARLAGVRVIFASGQSGSGADGLPPEVFPLDGAPHDWLFPRTAAVVHHGGPGTAAVAIAAGRPQVICPFMADQPFWGARLHRLGLAPAPVARSALTAASLADAISSALAGGLMPRRAEALGRLVRAEDGTATAVAMLEQHLATWRPAVRSAA